MPSTGKRSSSARAILQPDLLGRARAREQHRELVAAEAGEDVVGAQDAAQARADLGEHGVAGVMAERVVELLEAVDVDDQQRQRLVVCARAGQMRAQPAAELAAVGQAGELVGRRLAARLVEAADLADGERGAGHRGEHGRPRERDRDRRDVLERRRRRAAPARRRRRAAAAPARPGGRDRPCAGFSSGCQLGERHDHERDHPQRVEHGAGGVGVGGEAREVERVGDGEQPEAGRQAAPMRGRRAARAGRAPRP